jgi:hypothetical protein
MRRWSWPGETPASNHAGGVSRGRPGGGGGGLAVAPACEGRAVCGRAAGSATGGGASRGAGRRAQQVRLRLYWMPLAVAYGPQHTALQVECPHAWWMMWRPDGARTHSFCLSPIVMTFHGDVDVQGGAHAGPSGSCCKAWAAVRARPRTIGAHCSTTQLRGGGGMLRPCSADAAAECGGQGFARGAVAAGAVGGPCRRHGVMHAAAGAVHGVVTHLHAVCSGCLCS